MAEPAAVALRVSTQQHQPQTQPQQQPQPQPRKHQHHHQHQPQPATGNGSWVKVREPHEHQHGYSVFQSDENETTIVDSDYSDYEDDNEKSSPSAATRTVATLSVVMPRQQQRLQADSIDTVAAAERLSAFLLAKEDEFEEDNAWQTLPNGVTASLETLAEDDEERIEPATAPSRLLAVDQPDVLSGDDPAAARESLYELDRALAVFEIASNTEEEFNGEMTGKIAVDAEFVDEVEILPEPTKAAVRN